MRPITNGDLDGVFRALAHPIRRSLVECLAAGPRTVVEMAEPFDVSLNAVSKHLKTLESAGLVRRERDGNYHRMHLEVGSMTPALDWFARYVPFWRQSLAALRQHAEGS